MKHTIELLKEIIPQVTRDETKAIREEDHNTATYLKNVREDYEQSIKILENHE